MAEPRSKNFKIGAVVLVLVAAGALGYVMMNHEPEGTGFVADDPAKVEALKQQPEQGMRARQAPQEAIDNAVRSDDPAYLAAPKADGGEQEIPKAVTPTIKRQPKPKKDKG